MQSIDRPDLQSGGEATDPAMAFPVGASVTLEALSRDPYPIYARMRETEPVSWVPALDMYYVVRYEHVCTILQDTRNFTVGTERSTLFDTFGAHMLTVEDPLHERYKAAFRPAFLPGALRVALEQRIRRHSAELISGFANEGEVELRHAYAARLPILTMLSFLGLPLEREADMRRWYDSFEQALANFLWDTEVRSRARRNVEELRELIQERIEHFRRRADESALLSVLANAPSGSRLDDEAIQRNALITLFGGISTVEALILNAVYALSTHPETLERVRADLSLTPAVVDETARWAGPVQSATRHVARDTRIAGVELPAGKTVNCMIAAANRDPAKYADPDEFDITRPGLRQHLGFAAGPHHCLGSNLARLECRIALEHLLSLLPEFRMRSDEGSAPRGHEFRQPQRLTLEWR